MLLLMIRTHMLRLGWLSGVPVVFLFGFSLALGPLFNSPNIDEQLLFAIGSPNCTLSTFPGGISLRPYVRKCICKENPKSHLDLGLRVCQY